MNTTLKKRLEIGAYIVGGGALIVVAAIGGPALGQAIRPAAPEPTPTVAAASPTATPTMTPTPSAAPTVAPVVEAPAPAPEAPAEPEYTPGQSGDLVPFVASSDPNNANGGDYVDPGSYCLSGSASGAPPVCD